MNFYCCVHTQKSLDVHTYYSKNRLSSESLDRTIPYKFICGTQHRTEFTTPILNAYDGNNIAKYNKYLRYFSTLYHIINHLEDDVFYYQNCSTFLIKYDLNKCLLYDVSQNIHEADAIYETPGNYRNFMKNNIEMIYKNSKNDKSKVHDFYKNTFDFDLWGD